MNPDQLISLTSLVVTTILTCFVGYLTYLTLKFTTKPRLRISLRRPKAKCEYRAGELAIVRFYVENIGYWYGRPAATNVRVYVNFESAFEPMGLRFGSQTEVTEKNVRLGKRGSKYLRAKGIHLFYGEPGEEIVATVKTPTKDGRYRCWLSASSDQGDCGTFAFYLLISRAVNYPGDKAKLSGSVG